jgi:hypothetical protein
MPPIEFKAPWSRGLRLRTVAITSFLVLTAIVGFLLSVHQSLIWQLVLIALPMSLLLISLVRSVRGYSLNDREIAVKHVIGRTVLALDAVRSVEGNSEIMKGSICLLANCGLFSFSGWYFNRRLKVYKAMVSDPSRAIVLRLKRSVLVISPHDPQQFIVRARTFLKTAGFPS